MNVVLLDGRARPVAVQLEEQAASVVRLRPGASVSALTWGPPNGPASPAGPVAPAGPAAPALDRLVVLCAQAPEQPARGTTATRLRRLVLRLLTGGGTAARFARAARRNTTARGLLDRADLVVALDAATIRPAWHVARRRRSAHVVYGLASAERVLKSS